MANRNPVEGACRQLVDLGIVTYSQLAAKLRNYLQRAEDAFEEAVSEPKITSRDQITSRNSQPIAPITSPLGLGHFNFPNMEAGKDNNSEVSVVSENQIKVALSAKSEVTPKNEGGVKEVLRKVLSAPCPLVLSLSSPYPLLYLLSLSFTSHSPCSSALPLFRIPSSFHVRYLFLFCAHMSFVSN